ncbi:uncharacterized protein BDZ99DRAFT_565517 [Mytilinidion resinicola]|uniref:Uncharacterized protein n=1 Tax=Mytilinidion resinicola TaxID=574789 RepID=A0A6A6ZAV7_9PEZI|nr:uncharacterized protein BDZ99DRAFT_565517 [Mytilinidion resinicola]KAF2817978.1 hypothetical protein BDZ99DRAFT_565517 [Mytilinidion resinicola]
MPQKTPHPATKLQFSKTIAPPCAASAPPNSPSTTPTTKPRAPSTHLATPKQLHHPTQKATVCGHPLHPSASPKTRSCTPCVMSTVLRLYDLASARFDALGGLHLPPSLRNLAWNHARLGLIQAIKSSLAAEHRRCAREEAEKQWDRVHKAPLCPKEPGVVGVVEETRCLACATLSGKKVEVMEDVSWVMGMLEAARGEGVWWEKASAADPISTSMSHDRNRDARNRRLSTVRFPSACRRKTGPKGSGVMREIKKQAEFDLALKRVREKRQLRDSGVREIEEMLRRKHNLPKTMRYQKGTFLRPYAEHKAREWFVWSWEEKIRARGFARVRAWERKPSPLWCVINVDDLGEVEGDESTQEGEREGEIGEVVAENPWEFIDLLYIVG